jgi:hypothetical protein
MSGWDACTMEPNSILRWVECHPGLAGYLQALGVVAAVLVAFFAPRIADYFSRQQHAADVRANTKNVVRIFKKEMPDVLSKCAALRIFIEQQKPPSVDGNSWSEWFQSIGYVMPPTLAYYSQLTAETEVEPVAPFVNVAELIMDYNGKRGDLLVAGKIYDVEQWNAVRKALLDAIGTVEAAASVAVMPDEKNGTGGFVRRYRMPANFLGAHAG